MAYIDPPTVAAATVAPASLWNTYVRANFQAMDRGVVGTHSIGTGGGFGERYYPTLPTQTGSHASATAKANGTFYCVPLIAPRDGTIDRLAYQVTTAGGAGGVGRADIYQATSETNPYPNALIVDGGEHVVTSTGLKTSTISVALEPDVLYWAVVIFGVNAPNIYDHTSDAPVWSPIGFDPAVGLNSGLPVGFTRTQTYGALPATFPASPATSIVNTPPLMVMRFSV